MTYILKHLLIMELRFDAILYSKLGNKNSDAGHIKRSRGLARGPQVSYPCSEVWCVSIIRGVVGWERVGTAFPHLLALITLLESPGAA